MEMDGGVSEELRIELTPDESEDTLGTVAICFAIHRGRVVIIEEWGDMAELWSDRVNITIPRRVWDEALAWLTPRLSPAMSG